VQLLRDVSGRCRPASSGRHAARRVRLRRTLRLVARQDRAHRDGQCRRRPNPWPCPEHLQCRSAGTVVARAMSPRHS